MTRGQPIAIIGMACLYPGAPDLDAFWRNILAKVDAVSDPPPGLEALNEAYDPDSDRPGSIYCRRGGFLGDLARFDPLANDTPPVAVGGEPDQWLALQLARDALADAGYASPPEEVRRRTAVIIGRAPYFNAGTAVPVQHSLVLRQTLNIIRSVRPDLGDEELEELAGALRRSLPQLAPDKVPGLIPNIIAGRIANRLDLMGPTYTVDAACASSLVAVQLGVRDLQDGECDLALVGGSQVSEPLHIFSVFSQLGALSRKQQIRPFDGDADGTVLGQGIGMLVLKRLVDAERDGDRVYAVIRGVGVASDGRAVGIMAPRQEGQELALRRAYEAAGLSPQSVGLIEAHATATPLGDAVELETLSRVFGNRSSALPPTAVGTVKSMIGHTIPAAGAAGMIKAALALYHKVLPPTLNVERPNPALDRPSTPFYVNTDARPWVHGDSGAPRRAGVSAFGFGGINTHVVLEEYTPNNRPEQDRPVPHHRPAWTSEVCLIRAPTRGLLRQEAARLAEFVSQCFEDDEAAGIALADIALTLALRAREERPDSNLSLAIVATSLQDLRAKLERAIARLDDIRVRQIRDGSGIYFSEQPLKREGKLAFLFPGEGAQYANMLADLCLHFPEALQAFDKTDRVYREHGNDHVPSDYVFPRRAFKPEDAAWAEERLWEMDGAIAAVLTADEALLNLVRGLGLEPDGVVGHSSGEFAALKAAGVFGPVGTEPDPLSRTLMGVHELTFGRLDIPPASLLAIGAGREEVEPLLAEAGSGARIAMDNCPHQVVVIATDQGAEERLMEAARREMLIVEKLQFDRPYHTQLFSPYCEVLYPALSRTPVFAPRVPIYSCATVDLFPSDPDAIRRLATDQWRSAVEFRRTLLRMHDDGYRIFLEVGPRGNLTSFVEDSLRGRSFAAIAANSQRRSGLDQLNHMCAELCAQGVELDLRYLFRWRDAKPVDLTAKPIGRGKAPGLVLGTGFPAMRLDRELAVALAQQQKDDMEKAQPEKEALSTTTEQAGAPLPLTLSGPPVSAVPPISASADGYTQRLAATPLAEGAIPSRASSMTASFFETMDRFLAVEQHVMLGYMRRTGARLPGAGSADGASVLSGNGPSVTAPAQPQSGFPNASRLPLLGEVTLHRPGKELVTRRRFDPQEDVYLRDHAIGREVSRTDSSLAALTVMPLAMSLEILAEAAVALLPGRTVVELRGVRANRWLAFNNGPQDVEVTARLDNVDPSLVRVELRSLTEEQGQGSEARAIPLAQAVVRLADAYEPAPRIDQSQRPGLGPSSLRPEDLYTQIMFHGPSWQGVRSIDATGKDGLEATLEVLPSNGLLRSDPDPGLVLDPVILDSAGQLLGYWSIEHLRDGEFVMPLQAESIRFFGPRQNPGARFQTRLWVRYLDDHLLRCDITLAREGAAWIEIKGWTDRRFSLPPGLKEVAMPPVGFRTVTRPVPHLVPPGLQPDDFECRILPADLAGFGAFVKDVWALRILTRQERRLFTASGMTPEQQVDWLARRHAAKEAAAALLARRFGMDLLPADIEVREDSTGHTIVSGPWHRPDIGTICVAAVCQTAFTLGIAARVQPGQELRLGLAAASSRTGLALENLTANEEALVSRAFGNEPHAAKDEWRLRLQCAKEAALAAVPSGHGAVSISSLDQASGRVMVEVAGVGSLAAQTGARYESIAATCAIVN